MSPPRPLFLVALALAAASAAPPAQDDPPPLWFTWADSAGHEAYVCGPAELKGLPLDFGAVEFELPSWHWLGEGDPGHACAVLPAQQARALAFVAGKTLPETVELPYTLELEVAPVTGTPPAPGEVPLALTITNTDEVTVKYMNGGWQRGANRHGRVTVRAWRDGELLEPIGEALSFGGLDAERSLAPEEKLTERCDAARFAPITEPGDYRIEVTYSLNVTEPAHTHGTDNACSFRLRDFELLLVGETRFYLADRGR